MGTSMKIRTCLYTIFIKMKENNNFFYSLNTSFKLHNATSEQAQSPKKFDHNIDLTRTKNDKRLGIGITLI